MRCLPTSKKFHNKTVFAWGAFDLLRAGHIEYLKKARALGDTLIVAVYSDAIATRPHNKTRPIVPQKERMEILSSLSIVDRVISLTQSSPIRTIKKLTPDIVANHSSAIDPDLIEAIENLNIELVLIKVRGPQSTKALIQQIQKSFPANLQ
jgi:D-beta-D-heptose 7-phosphate kinase/D-beta-D-heptose 1-phosphate adenosyltransferase